MAPNGAADAIAIMGEFMSDDKLDKIIQLLEGLNTRVDKLIFIQTTNKSTNGQMDDKAAVLKNGVNQLSAASGRQTPTGNRTMVSDIKAIIKEERQKAMSKVQERMLSIPNADKAKK